MCTLIIRHKMDSGCSTVLAANRDEWYNRPSFPPRVLHQIPKVVGGYDEQGGGTWLGFTADGLFVGLTNQRNFDSFDPSLKSRGKLVVEALTQGTLLGVRTYLRTLDAPSYNEFNLLSGDGDEIFVAYGRGTSTNVEIESLGPGVHILCNNRIGTPGYLKPMRVAHLVKNIPPSPWSNIKDSLIRVMADSTLSEQNKHLPPHPNTPFSPEILARLQAICIHSPEYGTVSSTIAAVRPGKLLHYDFAAGPPDSIPFEDQMPIFRSMT